MLTTEDTLEQAKALFFEGLDSFEAGRFEQAEQQFGAALALVPGRVSIQINLAATLLKLAKPEQALAIAEQVLSVEPDNADAQFHRGTALDALGRYEDAWSSFGRVLASGAENVVVLMCHGQLAQRLGRKDQALASFDRALAIDDMLGVAWSSRGSVLREMGRFDEAAAAFRQALANGEDTELNRYYLASVDRTLKPAAAPSGYVESLFDDYANQFDHHLVDVLGYQAHAVLARAIAQRAAATKRRFASAVDLGCGTGLCGALVKPVVDRLAGVDLSTRMMNKARALDVYDELVHADLATFLDSRPAQFDLIVAADVLIYTGDLTPVFAAARRALRPDLPGMFCFSVELVDDGIAGDEDFVLLGSLRYAHSERHVRTLAAAHGFTVDAVSKEPIRQDQRESIPGLYVYLTTKAKEAITSAA